MKIRLTLVAMALSVLAAGPVFAGGAAGVLDALRALEPRRKPATHLRRAVR